VYTFTNVGNGFVAISRMVVATADKDKCCALIEKPLSKVKQLNTKKVYLFSNIKLKPAIGLYRKHCFQKTEK